MTEPSGVVARRVTPASRSLRAALAGIIGFLLAISGADGSELMTDGVNPRLPQSDSVQTITLAGDWQASCTRAGEVQTCRISTTATGGTKRGDPIIVQLASDVLDAERGLFFFLTPLDLLLAEGVEMRIDDGNALKLAYRSCHQQGCMVPFRLSAALENSFRSGTTLHLRLYEIDGSTVEVDLSLIGFVAANRVAQQR